MTVIPFSDAFITQYQDAFEELLRLGSVSAQRGVDGKKSMVDDDKAQRLLIVLTALSSPGLTTAQTESLEYCLRALNESLTVPTADSLLPQDIVPPRYSLKLYPILYNLTMQDVDFTFALQFPVDPAEYVLTMQNFDTVFTDGFPAYTVTFDPAVYVLTMQDATLTFTLGTLDIKILLQDAFIAQTWKAKFGSGARSTLTATGDPLDDISEGNRLYSDSISCEVWKTSNLGDTLEAGTVVFRRIPFGSTEVDEPGGITPAGSGDGNQSFALGQYLGLPALITYSFTGLGVGDQISANIYEG